MKGNVFFDHLVSLSGIRKGQDEIYEAQFAPESRARHKVEALSAPNRSGSVLDDGEVGDVGDEERQRDVTGNHVIQAVEVSATLEGMGTQLASSHLKRLHELMASPAGGGGRSFTYQTKSFKVRSLEGDQVLP